MTPIQHFTLRHSVYLIVSRLRSSVCVAAAEALLSPQPPSEDAKSVVAWTKCAGKEYDDFGARFVLRHSRVSSCLGIISYLPLR